jgi:uncharacterized protein YjgD (DUF1641 family)
MAHPIAFKPQPVDPHQELMQRVEEAPREHAEALLVAWDLLQTAHDQGILDLAQGLIGGRDIVAAKVAEGMAMPESIAALRNLIALGRILGAVDPDVLHRLARALSEGAHATVQREKDNNQAKMAPGDKLAPPSDARVHGEHPSERPSPAAQAPPRRENEKPPSLWRIFRQVASEDGRRGLALAANLLTAVGRAGRD